MTEADDSNKKLLDELDFLHNLWKEQKQKQKPKEKQFLEGSYSRNQDDFQNITDKRSKNKLTEKRYKTPWEAGEENTKEKYERKRPPKTDNFKRNQDREFRNPHKNVENTSRYNKSKKSREFRGTRDEGFDYLAEMPDFNILDKELERHGGENQDQVAQSLKKGETTKKVSWGDNQLKPMDSRYDEDYLSHKGDTNEELTESNKSWKKLRNSQESNYNRENGRANVKEEKFQKQWDSNEPEPTNRRWGNRGQSSYGKRNKRYKEFRSLKRERDKEKYDRFKTRNYDRPYLEDSNNHRTNWKWGNRGQSPSENRTQRHKEDRGWNPDEFDERNDQLNTRHNDDPNNFEGSKYRGESWKRDKRRQSPSENRSEPYKEFRGEKSQKFEKRSNKFNFRDYDGRRDFEESRNKERNWKWDRRGQSPSEDRNSSYKEQRGWRSDKFKGRNYNFKSRDDEEEKDFRESRYQGSRRKFEKNPFNKSGYYNERDKENDDQTTSKIPDTSSMEMVRRREWGAPKTKWGIGPPLKFPLKYIFCMPTNKNRCFTLKQCTKELLYLHRRHTSTPTCPDIKFSFLIGSNGTVYECRGWRTRPGLPTQYEGSNKDSLLIAFAGKYNKYSVPPAMITARDYVIDYGVKHDLIDKNYTIRSALDHATVRSESDVDHDQETGDHKTEDEENQNEEDRDNQKKIQEKDRKGWKHENKKKKEITKRSQKKDREDESKSQRDDVETDDKETLDHASDYINTDDFDLLDSQYYETDDRQYGDQEEFQIHDRQKKIKEKARKESKHENKKEGEMIKKNQKNEEKEREHKPQNQWDDVETEDQETQRDQESDYIKVDDFNLLDSQYYVTDESQYGDPEEFQSQDQQNKLKEKGRKESKHKSKKERKMAKRNKKDEEEEREQESKNQRDNVETEDQETDNQEDQYKLGPALEKQLLDMMSSGSETSGTVKSWVSYTSSWDLSEGDIEKMNLIDEEKSGAEI